MNSGVVVFVFSLLVTAAQAVGPLPSSWDIRGTVFFPLSRGDLGANATLAQLDLLPTTLPGANTVAINWMWRQDLFNSSTVYISDEATPTNDELAAFFARAQRNGLAVLLKPLVVFRDGGQMFQINPADPAQWFASYSTLLLDVLQLAAGYPNVAAVAVGVELQLLSTNPALTPYWTALIAKVRSSGFKGELTYCSNPLSNETHAVTFWSQLDYIGLDLYIPYVLNRSSSADLILHRDTMVTTFNHVWQRIMDWYTASPEAQQGIKMVVTEMGYPSCNYGMQNPWIYIDVCNDTKAMNLTAQAVAFDVAFTQLAQYAEVMRGVAQFWWGTEGNSDAYEHRDEPGSTWGCGWTPVGKPDTMAVLQQAFAKPADTAVSDTSRH